MVLWRGATRRRTELLRLWCSGWAAGVDWLGRCAGEARPPPPPCRWLGMASGVDMYACCSRCWLEPVTPCRYPKGAAWIGAHQHTAPLRGRTLEKKTFLPIISGSGAPKPRFY